MSSIVSLPKRLVRRLASKWTDNVSRRNGHIPTEILVAIVFHLDADDSGSLSLACRHFRFVGQAGVYRHLVLFSHWGIRSAQENARYFRAKPHLASSVKEVTLRHRLLDEPGLDILFAALQEFTTVTHLTIHSSLPVGSRNLEDLKETVFPKLKYLSVSVPWFPIDAIAPCREIRAYTEDFMQTSGYENNDTRLLHHILTLAGRNINAGDETPSNRFPLTYFRFHISSNAVAAYSTFFKSAHVSLAFLDILGGVTYEEDWANSHNLRLVILHNYRTLVHLSLPYMHPPRIFPIQNGVTPADPEPIILLPHLPNLLNLSLSTWSSSDFFTRSEDSWASAYTETHWIKDNCSDWIVRCVAANIGALEASHPLRYMTVSRIWHNAAQEDQWHHLDVALDATPYLLNFEAVKFPRQDGVGQVMRRLLPNVFCGRGWDNSQSPESKQQMKFRFQELKFLVQYRRKIHHHHLLRDETKASQTLVILEFAFAVVALMVFVRGPSALKEEYLYLEVNEHSDGTSLHCMKGNSIQRSRQAALLGFATRTVAMAEALARESPAYTLSAE
ncbi:hypothetical protein DL96DRAFT_1708181 [Flagelloscypha sp. PMI_526]|nr:hypothetical protein DL96DRAFT_1708181 [Flagelloscypha sp. PMI_526]